MNKKEFRQLQKEYMVNKFGKNRSVDHRYLNVPIKYVLNYIGSNSDSPDKYRDETYEEWKERQQQWLDLGIDINKEEYEACKKEGYLKQVLVKEGTDKTLCIVDFYGKNKALVAWRNNNKCKMGMTRICPIVSRGNKTYLNYKGKLILISNDDGWVW